MTDAPRASAAAVETELADSARLLAALPRRLGDIVDINATRHPGRPALRERGRQWTYATLCEASESAARGLRQAEVRPGDRVMIVGENCAAMVALLFAVGSLDAWTVLVNARLSAPEVDAIRDHCAPRRIIYLRHVSPEAGAHARRHDADGILVIAAMDDVVLGRGSLDGEPEPVHDDAARQVAALIYTSGTTGLPKGVMLTHRNLLFIAKVSSTLRRLGPGDCVYGVLPFSHVYGLASVCLGTLFAGACLDIEPRYSPKAMLRALTDGAITVVQGVPAMYARLLDLIRTLDRPCVAPALRFLYAGGSPLDPELKAEVERVFGLTLHNGYGLTESSPTVTQTRIDAPRTDCSVGMVLPGVAVRVVDAGGGDVREGGAGEVLVRGPNVMLGYYRDAALTAQAIDGEGWLRTGDIARRESDGALFIVGRKSELIIRSGFNVYPAEVEAVLNAHPAISHSAVIGRKVPGNEEVIAFVELGSGQRATAPELAQFAAPRLAPYKRPAEIVILSKLPASATGKILKHQLRMMAEGGMHEPNNY
ncbi:MAG: AMP-binding protein [Betaproteobacteria bacterium]